MQSKKRFLKKAWQKLSGVTPTGFFFSREKKSQQKKSGIPHFLLGRKQTKKSVFHRQRKSVCRAMDFIRGAIYSF